VKVKPPIPRHTLGPFLTAAFIFALTSPVPVCRSDAGPMFAAPYLAFGQGVLCRSIGVADFNGDGELDVAGIHAYLDVLWVFTGDGNGTLSGQRSFITGALPTVIAVRDLNGDGRPDIVSVSNTTNKVSILINDGAGGFPTRTLLTTAASPYDVAIDDFNGDGRLDLVVPCSGVISVFLGTTPGTFGTRSDLPASVGSPGRVRCRDLNGDLRPDLVVCSNQNAIVIAVFLGVGDGSFVAAGGVSYAGYRYSNLAIGDLNGDTRADIVATSCCSDSMVSVALGNGDGTFGPPADYHCDRDPSSVAIVDLEANGHMDLVISNDGKDSYERNTVSVLLGHGDGTFDYRRDYDSGRFPDDLAVGDMNDDGRPDLVIGRVLSPGLAVMLSNGDGTFGITKHTYFGSYRARTTVAGDFDGDGRSDVVVGGGGNSGFLASMSGQGDGTFSAPTTLATTGQVTGAVVTDFDRDGRLDLALTQYGNSDSLLALRGVGDGTFTVSARYAAGHAGVNALVARDLNGDGETDLVSADYGDHTMSVYLGLGGGTFATRAIYPLGIGPTAVAVGDLNGDQILDVIMTGGTNSLVRLLGNGDGTFGPPSVLPFSGSPSAIAMGDLDQDGYQDVVLNNNQMVSILFGQAGGALASRLDIPANNIIGWFSLVDFDGDQHLDIATTGDQYVVVVLNHGDRAFGPALMFGSEWDPAPMVAADVNGDSRPDLVVGCQSARTVLSLINLTGGAPLGIEVPAPPPSTLRLEAPHPNPALGRFGISVSLVSGHRATLELFDTAGRMRMRQELGDLGPGRHQIEMAAGESISSGVYFLRLTEGSGTVLRRVVLLH
jgi:VCBS repeat protein